MREKVRKEMRKFYAEKCEYGLNVSYSSLNGNAYTFYAFDSKKERDEFAVEILHAAGIVID